MQAEVGNNGNDGLQKAVARIFLFLVTLVALFLCFGCKTTEYVEVPVTHTEYVYRDRVDTSYVKDSVYIKEYVKGDTVRLVEYRYRDRFRYVYKNDTIAVRDTISVVVEKVVVKEDHTLKKWQKALIWWGVICTLALIAFIYIKIRFPKR